MDGVTLVVLRGVANIPALDAVWCPGAPLVGRFVQEDLGAKWGQGGTIEIKCAIQIFFGGGETTVVN
jgi:hypothetical protein